MTEYQTRYTIGYTDIIGLDSTIYMFSSLPTQRMITYNINTAEINVANLRIHENGPFSDGNSLYLAAMQYTGDGIGDHGICQVKLAC